MLPVDCKRLIEVDFPIAEVSVHSAREKSIRHGHPSTLHLWWARRPLAACRAVLMGLLLPDPADANCPDDFKRDARRLLSGLPVPLEPDDDGLRTSLLKFIAQFADWNLSTNRTYLAAARGLVKAAHGGDVPLVVDPFAGGGSIPLEALRLGCDAFASDLNPVACLILKTLLEDIPRHGAGLADELRAAGAQIKAEAEKELAEFYPPDPDGAKPIAYIWARTVRCESPGCGAEIPLARSFWLAKKEVWRREKGQRIKVRGKQALRYVVERPKGDAPFLTFEIFEPTSSRDVPEGTVTRANATCPCCCVVLRATRVRAQLSAQRGGADVVFDDDGKRVGGATLLAVVTRKESEVGSHFRLATERDYAAAYAAQSAVAELPDGAVPDEPTPWKHSHRAVGSPRVYGMDNWGDLFTARQKLALVTLAKKVCELPEDTKRQQAVKDLLAIGVNRQADGLSVLCTWLASYTEVKHVFSRQALSMVWDTAESNPLEEGSRSWGWAIEWIAKVINYAISATAIGGQVEMADACNSPLPDESCSLWFTDPPYWDNVAYADLADFFYVWLKRTQPDQSLLRDPFNPNNPLTPKAQELTVTTAVDEHSPPKDGTFFLEGMSRAFSEGRRVMREDGIGCVVFAHKTTDGWEALLSGMLRAGWVITASWPITTEMATRMVARDTAALAASVHLVCRPRPEDAPVGDWGEVIRALPRRIREWVDRLSREGIRGADLVFSCIGPALELFSRYRCVETPDGEAIGLAENPNAHSEAAQRGFLSYIWEMVGRAALQQVLGSGDGEGTVGALEEDARLTALFLWTLQSTEAHNGQTGESEADEADDDAAGDADEDAPPPKLKGLSLPFDVVRRFALPLGIHLPDWEQRVIAIEKGIVRLLPVRERAKQLFGEESAAKIAQIADAAVSGRESLQLLLFPDAEGAAPNLVRSPPRRSQEFSGEMRPRREATTLDRVHAAMLLQSSGASNALRTLLGEETQRGPDFLRLANALSALYPRDSEEKRLLDGMVLAVPKS